MNIVKLEKATKIYEQIKQLDNAIIEIDRIAMLIANGEVSCSFDLKVNDLTKTEEQCQVGFDEDGSLRSACDPIHPYRLSFSLLGGVLRNTTPPPVNENILKAELTENTALSILGVLLCDKQYQRDQLINQLERLGVAI
jgi:hypothetical protein